MYTNRYWFVRGPGGSHSRTVQEKAVPLVSVTASTANTDTNTAEPNTIVQLWGKTPHQRRFTVLAAAATDSTGNYAFTQSGLMMNTTYYVATMPLPHVSRRHTALLYQGARDSVSLQASSTNATSGQTVTFSGSVLPDKPGHIVYLQTLGSDGDWHTVQLAVSARDSTLQFTWTAAPPGTQRFRARITSDRDNVGSTSTPVSITVAAPAASTLPPAS